MPHLSTDNTQIYYETFGNGEPLVMIPGFGCDMLYFETIKQIFAPYFQLILLDNRCTGRSECQEKPLTIEKMAQDVATLIDHLELDKAHILGHSMGGAIAQSLAQGFPQKVEKLVLYNSIIKLSAIAASVIRYVISLKEDKAPIRYEIDAFMPWLFSNEFMEDPNKRAFFVHYKENEPFPMTLMGLKKQFDALLKFDSSSWKNPIQTETLVLTGREDLCCPASAAEEYAEKLPNGKFYCFEKQGHSTHLEKPEEFCKVVLDYLK